MLPDKLLPTTVVGSYPQPDWLVDRETLQRGTVPRVLQAGFWRVPDDALAEALDDAAT
ncbi:MAG: 5-methyltetrahydropteroyltriglutamate--homocysteine methyltransferase, partial [Chloroflexota bacterium]|nr:5-methyltetrahydropteroyltriglutamate--homocysteine methyltransferase [Chloroflexota bacterium]